MNQPSLQSLILAYDPTKPLEEASTIPSSWYTDSRILGRERKTVFGESWQAIGRLDQLKEAGRYITADVVGEPIVVVRGGDRRLRGFFNVCRHHAAAVVTQAQGRSSVLRCPYHGWTYALDGRLKAAPEFESVCHFDKSKNGLAPVRVDTWEQFVFVKMEAGGISLSDYLGGLATRIKSLKIGRLKFVERRTYTLNCNWKVFVDNYLDGGYHVPHLHKGLSSVLDYSAYTIETGDRFCVQSSPVRSGKGDRQTKAVRKGERTYYYWLYPNFMLNWYEGVMDTNLVLPLGPDRTLVVFDFYFDHAGGPSAARNSASIAVSDRIQQEDVGISEAVQRGLQSRAYDTGRLSVRREAGEHLFHKLLFEDLVKE